MPLARRRRYSVTPEDEERLQMARDALRDWLARRLDRMNDEIAPKIAAAEGGPKEVERIMRDALEEVAEEMDEWLAQFTFPPGGEQ